MAVLLLSQKNIFKMHTNIKSKKIIIPDYQRPYKWNFGKGENLWNDIENLSYTETHDGEYNILGSFVSYVVDNRDQEITEMQLSLTSFFLLPHAFYCKIKDMPENDNVKVLKNQINLNTLN